MALVTGAKLGPYEIEAPLGAGGMGEVYRARDTRLQRSVAIKILPAQLSFDPARKQRFEREAKTISSLNHPHICVLYDIGSQDGTDYLVMECVEGETLAKRLEKGPLPLEQVLKFGAQIADALDKAHRAGIVHRDLKPGNVILTPTGAKLLDFGLAKPTAALLGGVTLTGAAPPSPVTQEGTIVGTYQYMSPEQVEGKEVDGRSDIFSLGAVLYEMVTGKRAFEGKSQLSVASAILEKEPAPISSSKPMTPPALDRLIRVCLAKDPEERWRSVHDIKLQLQSIAEIGAAALVPQARSRERALLLGLAAMALLVVALAVLVFRHPTPQQLAMRFSEVTNFPGYEAEPSFSPDARSIAFVSDRGGAFDIWVGLVSGGTPIRITNDPNVKASPRWSPGGGTITYSRLNESGLWDVWTVPALGGTPRKIIVNAKDSAWSPDGRSLVYANGSDGALWICDASGSDARALTKPENDLGGLVVHSEPAFSHDATKITFVRKSLGPYAELALLELSSGKITKLTADRALALSPAWSADNRFIYFASSRGGTVNVWKISATGGSPEQITAGRGDDDDLDLSADGQRLVFATHRRNANLKELIIGANGEPVRSQWLTTDSSHANATPVYSRDGHHIAYFTARKGAEKEAIWMVDADGSNPTKLSEDERINTFPRWTYDSKALIFRSVKTAGSPAAELAQVFLSGAAPEILSLPSGQLSWFAMGWGDVGPDGRLLFRNVNGQIEVWDPKSKKMQILDKASGALLRWSPDGRHVSFLIPARQPEDQQAGVWTYDFVGEPRQAFRGWICWYAWAGADELFVLQGKPDLKGVLWRVPLVGLPQRIADSVPLTAPSSHAGVSNGRFDVSPDHRRIVLEADRFLEADIGMIEGIR